MSYHQEASPIERLNDFRPGTPAQARPCLDDARRYSGCKPTACTFFANGHKLPGCVNYSALEASRAKELEAVAVVVHNLRRKVG